MKTALIWCFAFLGASFAAHANEVDTLKFGSVGKVVVYHPLEKPNAFVLFISGDGGWNSGVVEMSGHVVSKGAMVAGINIVQYMKSVNQMKSPCFYPAGDLEEISMSIQKKYHFTQYEKPILIGYSSGATLVYGALAQAPANTFKGAMAIGFCPDIEVSKPLCKGSGLSSHVLKPGKSFYLDDCPTLTAPFIAFNGTIDQICNYADTKKFIDRMPMAEIISLPNVGHGFAVVRNWLPQFIAAYNKLVDEPDYATKMAARNDPAPSSGESPKNNDLPVIALPAASESNLPMAFFISGDGGWTSFDQTVCEQLAAKGMPVIGLDAQKYFWNEKSPEGTAGDFAPLIEEYLQRWHKTSFVMLGYSFGACVSPFIIEKFQENLKDKLSGVYCFSPDVTGDFEIHLSDMLHFKNQERYNVPEGLVRIKAYQPVCIFGDEEDEQTVGAFSRDGIRIEKLPGSHHYDDDYSAIAHVVLKDFSEPKPAR